MININMKSPFFAASSDQMYIKTYSFILFSSHPGVLTPVRGESSKIMDFDVSLPIAITSGVAKCLSANKNYGPPDNHMIFSKSLAINGFELSLPVAVCSGLANQLVINYRGN